MLVHIFFTSFTLLVVLNYFIGKYIYFPIELFQVIKTYWEKEVS